jgi:hypothetical protein
MRLSKHPLFLAGLFVAVSCSDAGNPVTAGGRDDPRVEPGPVNALQLVTCTVDQVAGTMSCEPTAPQMGGALGSIALSDPSVQLIMTNYVATSTSTTMDVAIQNMMDGQVMGTTDGVTAHPYGFRVFFWSAFDDTLPTPRVLSKVNPGDTAWVTVATPDSAVFADLDPDGVAHPYFQHAPEILGPSQSSTPTTWTFDHYNVATWTFNAWVSTEVRWPYGWTEVTPDNPVVETGSVTMLTALDRNHEGRADNTGLNWSSSDPLVVTVAELSPSDTLAEITAVSEGTAWVRAVSSGAPWARLDSVLVTVNSAPVVLQDTSAAVSNITVTRPAGRLLAKASDPAGQPLSVIPETVASANGGEVVIAADGGFAFLGAAGSDGEDSFQFQVTDGVSTTTGTMIVNVAASSYWYVQAGATGGDGRDRLPFGSVGAAQAVAGVNDSILVLPSASSLDEGVLLKNGQGLIGADIAAPIYFYMSATDSVAVLTPGAMPGLTRTSAGHTVQLAQDNAVAGLGISAGNGAAIQGSNFGTLTAHHLAVNPAGPALLLQDGNLNAEFMTLSSTGSLTSGLSLTNVSGVLNAPLGTLAPAAGATGRAVLVDSSSARIKLGVAVNGTRGIEITGVVADSVMLSGALTLTGEGISVHDNPGGVVSFTSAEAKSLSTGSNAAVLLASNAAASTVRFSGVLDITTTSGPGFSATGAGLVTATGANTVATGVGTPVTLSGVNTGTAGVSFSSISTGAGAANGIVLNGISGVGFQGTGGTIAGTTGPAVLLTSTSGADSVSLRNMSLSRSSGTGAVISGTSFGKLHVLNTSVQATGGLGALALNTGTMSGTYSAVSSNASTGSGVSLTGVNGTFNASAGSINTAGAAAFLVSGGSVGGTISATVAQASAQPLLSVTNGHSGAIAFAGNATATNGNGLQFDNADGSYTFTGTVTLQGGDAGIDITNGSGGTFTFPSTANIVSPSTGNLVSILNSAPTFTYPGAFTRANNNVTGILLSNNTGGSITFNGTGTKSISSGTAAAVNLANNGSASILFSGGGLSITSGSGAGITATGGGTVQVTGAANTISSTGGVALNVQNTTIGASGLSFRSISANGGANGIVLNNTGSNNGLQVTGTGTNGSGGTIQNTSVSGASFTNARNINLGQMNFTNANSVDGGGAGSCDQDTNAGCNAAIELSNVVGVSLDRLNVNGTVEHGINGRTVTGFSLTSSTILNAGDSGSEFAVSLFELFGTAGAGTESLISGNTLSEAGEHMVFVRNSTATSTSAASPDRLVISGNVIADPGMRNAAAGSQGGGVAVSLRGTANFQAVVQNNTFLASETATDGVRVDAGDNARSDATITGNYFSGSYTVGSTNIAAYNTAVNVSGSGSSNTTFSVTDNPAVTVGVGDAINVVSTGDANLSGTISGHTIETPAGLHDGAANHNNLENEAFGIDIVVEQTGSIVANVTGNTVAGGHKTGFRAIAHSGNGGSVDASVSGNVFNAGGKAAEWPVVLMAGNDAVGESVRLCVDLSSNQTSTTALSTNHYRMGVHDAPAAGFNNVMQLPGLVPASGATEAQVETHVDATDASPPPAGADKVEALGGEVINYTAAACATP